MIAGPDLLAPASSWAASTAATGTISGNALSVATTGPAPAFSANLDNGDSTPTYTMGLATQDTRGTGAANTGMGKFTLTPTVGGFVPQSTLAGTYTSNLTVESSPGHNGELNGREQSTRVRVAAINSAIAAAGGTISSTR